MKTHNKYYGQAMQEAERGIRRDDIWGKAFAQARGDKQAAAGLYIELLAEHLEREAGAAERRAEHIERTKEVLGNVAFVATNGVTWTFRFAFRWALRGVICFVIAVGLSFGGAAVYTQIKSERLYAEHMQRHADATAQAISVFQEYQLRSNHRKLSSEELRSDFSSLDRYKLRAKYALFYHDYDSVDTLYQVFESGKQIHNVVEYEATVTDQTKGGIAMAMFTVIFGGWLILGWKKFTKEQAR